MKPYLNHQGPCNGAANEIRNQSLYELFAESVGKKAFLMLPNFPYVYIGTIKESLDDYILMFVETTSIPALEKVEWWIHLDNVEVFAIEDGVKFPELKD